MRVCDSNLYDQATVEPSIRTTYARIKSLSFLPIYSTERPMNTPANTDTTYSINGDESNELSSNCGPRRDVRLRRLRKIFQQNISCRVH